MKRIILIAALALTSVPVFAQDVAQLRLHPPHVTGDVVKDVQSDINDVNGVTATGGVASSDPLAQLESKFNAKLKDDLTVALALAQQKDANGNTADQTAVPCYTSLLNLNALINNLSPTPIVSGTVAPQPGVVAGFEKLRIVKNAISSQNLKDSCAPLIQDIQTTGAQLLGNILAVVGGAAKVGIALP